MFDYTNEKENKQMKKEMCFRQILGYEKDDQNLTNNNFEIQRISLSWSVWAVLGFLKIKEECKKDSYGERFILRVKQLEKCLRRLK